MPITGIPINVITWTAWSSQTILVKSRYIAIVDIYIRENTTFSNIGHFPPKTPLSLRHSFLEVFEDTKKNSIDLHYMLLLETTSVSLRSGGKDLSASQGYPHQFGHRVARLHCKHMEQHMAVQSDYPKPCYDFHSILKGGFKDIYVATFPLGSFRYMYHWSLEVQRPFKIGVHHKDCLLKNVHHDHPKLGIKLLV